MLGSPTITVKGRNLLAKIVADNIPLTLSNIGLGDGLQEENEEVTILANEIMKKEIESCKYSEKEGQYYIRRVFTNADLEEGFYIREVGIYAIDPDEGEILYAYTNAGENGVDYFAPGKGKVIVKEIIEMATKFGNAENITVVIDPSIALVSEKEFEEYKNSNKVNTDNLQKQVTKNTTDLKEKANNLDTSPMYLGAFFESNENIGNNLFITGDGESILKINNKNVFSGRDTSILCRNGSFYFFHTQVSGTDCIEVEITKDLVNFETKNIKVSDDGSVIWAPDVFSDEEKTYIIYSKEVGEESTESGTYKDMRPYIAEITDLDTLAIGTPGILSLEGDSKISDNRIDGHIIKKDNIYYLFIKYNSMLGGGFPNGAIEIWQSSNLINWNCINEKLNDWIGLEAPFIFINNGLYYLYLDDFTPLNYVDGDFYKSNGGVTLYTTSSDLINWNSELKVLNEDIGTRHGFITKVLDEDCKRIIVNKTIPSLNATINNCNTKITELQTSADVIGIYNNIQFIMSNSTAYGVYRGFIPLKNASDYTITLIKMSYMDESVIEVTSTAALGEKNNLGFMVHNSDMNVAGKVCLLWFKVTK